MKWKYKFKIKDELEKIIKKTYFLKNTDKYKKFPNIFIHGTRCLYKELTRKSFFLYMYIFFLKNILLKNNFVSIN